jgi:D-alanyl-D-alanine carboxypeptidase
MTFRVPSGNRSSLFSRSSWLLVLVATCAHLGFSPVEALARDCTGIVPSKNWKPAKGDDFEFLQRNLATELGTSTSKRTRWSADVRAFGPCGERLLLFRWNADTPVRPASTQKVLTTWAIFERDNAVRDVNSAQFGVVRRMMKSSNNAAAERVLGWAGGVKAIGETFRQKQLPIPKGFRAVDGSGLSYSNRVAARQLVDVFVDVRYQPYLRAFRATLPVAGRDGTLMGRDFSRHGNVAAKTGTLTTDPAVALAGYGDTHSGWQIVFAFLGDGVTSVGAGRNSIDGALEETLRVMNYY